MKTLTTKILLITLLTFGAAATQQGCAKSVTVSHPGAVNAFDSNTADTIVTARGTIEAAKPIFTTPAQKAILNKVIDSFNLTEDAYKAYHSAAVVGGSPDPVALQALLRQLALDLVTIKGGPKP